MCVCVCVCVCRVSCVQSSATGRLIGAIVSNREDLEQWTVEAGKVRAHTISIPRCIKRRLLCIVWGVCVPHPYHQLSGDCVFPCIYTPELNLQEYNSKVHTHTHTLPYHMTLAVCLSVRRWLT